VNTKEKFEQNRRLRGLVTLADQGDRDALQTLKPEMEAIIYKGAFGTFRNFPFVDREEADSEAKLISIEKTDALLSRPTLGNIAKAGKSGGVRDNLVSYFFICGRNEAKDQLRKMRTHNSMEIPVDYQENDPVSEPTGVRSWSKTLDELLAHRLDLERCVNKLNNEEMKLLLMRMRDDMDYRDIADILKKKRDAIRKWWSRILGKLRKCMGVPS